MAGRKDGSFINCYATGQVRGNENVGGLIGNNYSGEVITCYATCTVGGYEYIGGLVGRASYSSWIDNCYATGTVRGEFYYIGGLVGYNDSSSHIENCYATGPVSSDYPYGESLVGGLIGRDYSYGGIKACFWDVNSSGVTEESVLPEVVGLTTAEMKTLSTFVDAGWYISDINGAEAHWIMLPDGVDYPQNIYYFYHNSAPVPLLGDGTEQNPYEIDSPEDFITLGQYGSAWDKHIKLMRNLDMAGFTVRPIGNTIIKFTGSFNGQGFEIRNAAIDTPNKDYVGLFGYVDDGGVITNLSVEEVNVVGEKYVGGLVGYNSKGTIFKCHSTGSADANSPSYIGGLVGVNFGGAISRCYSTVDVNSCGATTGGLAGLNGNGGTITNCFAAGDACVKSASSSELDVCIGGLVGHSGNGAIANCYAAGDACATGIQSSADICAGGLVGLENAGDVNNCYSMGNISYNSSSESSSESSYYLGGQVGFNYFGSVSNCYSTGKILGDETGDSDYFTGGFAGLIMGGEILRCFWDVETSEIERGFNLDLYCPGTVVNISSKTTEQMQNASTYVNVGWDFDYDDGDDADWFIQIDEYPILTWQISPADIYTDGRNDMKDFAVFAQYWMREDCATHNNCDGADMDLNGYVDTNDFSEFLSYWLESGIY